MIHMIAHYQVHGNTLAETLKAVEAFVLAIAANEPDPSYIAYQREDDPTKFVHTMAFSDETAVQQHQTADYTQDFVAALYPQCQELPVFTDLKLVCASW